MARKKVSFSEKEIKQILAMKTIGTDNYYICQRFKISETLNKRLKEWRN